MFDNLSERLERSFKILKGEGKITEINVAETLKDVRRALLDADVNYKVAKTFTDTVKQKALGQNVLTAVKPSQLMVKIVHDELATLMGGETAELNLQGHPSVILMAGLNGAGKTTLSGKLALMLKTKKRKNPLLAACDIYRPAAIEQLKVLGEQIGIPVYSEPDNKDAVQIAQNAVKEAKAKGNDVVIDNAAELKRFYYRLLRFALNASTAAGLSDGSLAFAPQLCDLGAECRMLLENIQSIADDNGIVLDVHIPEAPIECALDTALIQRMLLNIIANCMERCSRGDRIHIAVTQEGDRADIIICDDGTRIAPAKLGTIFIPLRVTGVDFSDLSSNGFGLTVALFTLTESIG